MTAMVESPVAVVASKPRKRTAVKASPVPQKMKLTLYVTVETSRRLGVYAAMTGTDRSSLVESLIADPLRRFVVSDRAKSAECVTVEESAN